MSIAKTDHLTNTKIAPINPIIRKAKISRGVVVVFKGVGADYKSERGASYKPGEKPEAEDWVANTRCGHGLHFSAKPVDTLRYAPNAKRWLACPVKIAESVLIDGDPKDKIKSRRVVGAGCVEVDIDGNPIKAAK